MVAVETNYPDAIVYIDSMRMGPANWRTFAATAGRHTLRLLAPGEAAWSIEPVEQEVTLTPGDTTHASLFFPLYHRIESLPLGATVYLREEQGRTALGKTPVTYPAPATTKGSFVVELFGYRVHEVVPGRDVWNRYVIQMQPLYDSSAPDVLPQVQSHKRRRWIDAAAAGLVVAGGILTVHHKFKADRLNDNYQATGDPDLRPRIARLDDRAAIALAGMQVGLVTIGVRFYLRR